MAQRSVNETMYVATDHGLAVWRREPHGQTACTYTLAGRRLTSIMARGGVILAGTTEGVFRSDDGGTNWSEASRNLAIRHVRWMAFHPAISDREFAGTEPAGIFRSHDGAASWRECSEVAQLRDKHRWFLPYSPEAGCVRGFAFEGDRAYAAVEVGGVLRSDDAGKSWRLAGGSTGQPVFEIPPEPLVHADVHSVVSHPSSPDLIFAVTAEGLYRSADGGDTWTVSHAGSYCRAAWIDPADPRHIILSPADSVARKNGRIEETWDGGASWSPVSDGLELPWPDTMIERFIELDGELFAITNHGHAYVSSLDAPHWQRVLPEVEGIRALTRME